MKKVFQNFNFTAKTLALIGQMVKIIEEYQEMGYTLTLRQLYYQLVARGLIENAVRSYKKVGRCLSNARLAGLVDWHAIEDRTRALKGTQHWKHPKDVLSAAYSSFRFDKWEDQPTRVEVWVEKDALTGVIAKTCRKYDINYFACRGYVSQSAMWRAARRLKSYTAAGQYPIILHLGDHDPSGMDMTRDIIDRLELFQLGHNGDDFEVRRIALNMDQIAQYDPPPNPAKLTDSRASEYIEKYGFESWELDALSPITLDSLVALEVEVERDEDLWLEQVEREKVARTGLKAIHDNHAAVVEFLSDIP